MGDSDLKLRTKEYALGIIRLFSELPKRTEVQILGRQLFRSGTSVGAQYREATRGKSTADFISKIEGSGDLGEHIVKVVQAKTILNPVPVQAPRPSSEAAVAVNEKPEKREGGEQQGEGKQSEAPPAKDVAT